MGFDIIVAMGILGAFGYFVVWGDWIRPHVPAAAPRRVNTLPSPPPFKRRSRRSTRSNAFRARSTQQEAQNTITERSAERSPGAAAAAPAVELQITQKELTQLVNAVALTIEGKTEQEALETAFSCTKGGGKSWKRAKELYDLARPQA